MESAVRGVTMILLKDVSYEWEDGRTALKNINLEIKKGEFILILDEPSANLDMKATFDLFSILEKIKK